MPPDVQKVFFAPPGAACLQLLLAARNQAPLERDVISFRS